MSVVHALHLIFRIIVTVNVINNVTVIIVIVLVISYVGCTQCLLVRLQLKQLRAGPVSVSMQGATDQEVNQTAVPWAVTKSELRDTLHQYRVLHLAVDTLQAYTNGAQTQLTFPVDELSFVCRCGRD